MNYGFSSTLWASVQLNGTSTIYIVFGASAIAGPVPISVISGFLPGYALVFNLKS